MITESFINACFSLALNKNTKIKKTKSLFRDILNVIAFSEQKETLEIPLIVKSKVDCLKKILEMLANDKPVDAILDSISFSEKFNQHKDFLESKISEPLKDGAILELVKHVLLRKKMVALFANYDELNKVLDSIKEGTFDSLDDVIFDYEITIRRLYSNLMDSNRELAIQAASSLDLVKDDFTHVLEMILKKYDDNNATPTGFSLLDGSLMRGGFEPSRLYVFCGSPGSGKSTLLNNFIYRAAEQGFKDNSKKNVFIYVTLENTIEESLMRTYMPMFGKTIPGMIRDITNGVNIKSLIQSKMNDTNSTIVMKYFPAMSISTIDLMGVIDDVISEYGKESIRGLYVDYLDLLRTETKYDLYRLELGHITLSLKTLAVEYNIPVITASQLGRGSYRVTDSKDLNLDQVTESIKKVEHADFIMLLSQDSLTGNIVHAKIGKHRAGKKNVSIDFKVKFEEFKFLEAVMKTAEERDGGELLKMDSSRQSTYEKPASSNQTDGFSFSNTI
jgi:replicative DNA helicase